MSNAAKLPKQLVSNPLWYSGLMLIALGLIHTPLPLLDGTDWEGSVSWRKPILFGISTGLTLCSLGWLANHIPSIKTDRPVAWFVSVSLVAEVGLITLQQWRGTASHFNQATALDSNIDRAMLVLIVVAFAGIVYFAIRSLSKSNLTPDYALAARFGMFFLILSCVIGFVISSHGYQQAAAGLSPETVGARGVAKFPHGVAIHALQILPVVVWILKRFKLQISNVNWCVWSLSMSLLVQVIFACYQTLNGFARFELETATGFGLLLAAVVLAPAPVAFAAKSIIKPT